VGVAAVIIKRTRGVSAAKALAYDYGPGRRQEHHNPRRLAGTVAGRDWRARGRSMQIKLREDGDTAAGKRGRVLRLAVSAAPQDRVMSDREWAGIAERVVGEFTGGKAEGYAWEAVRHDPRHIHITLLQRGHDGRLLSESHDYRRFGRISEGIERDYGLRAVDHSRTDTPERKARRSAYRQAAAAERRGRPGGGREEPGAGGRSGRASAPGPQPGSREERLAAARAEAERRDAARRAQREQGREQGRGRGG
jgi:hypothetical protein